MKRLLAAGGIEAYTPREIFCEAVAGLITDPKIWFNFLRIRNITVLINDKELFNLQDESAESNLSIKVDVKRWLIDYDEGFKELIKNDLIEMT